LPIPGVPEARRETTRPTAPLPPHARFLPTEPGAAEPGPFLKWAGGKGQVLAQLAPHFPARFNRYFEPFVGSGAVFFFLRRTRRRFPATLTDSNLDLVNAYAAVRDSVSELVPLLEAHQRRHSKSYYYRVRDEARLEHLTPVERAARLIYLNKTCYNGLYRVNRKGKFNVPVGSYERPALFRRGNLEAASGALAGTALRHADFSSVLESARRGDFVYFDPPYYTTGLGFTGYAVAASGQAAFGAEEHYRLSRVVRKLAERGCSVLVSNSDTGFVRRIYDGFSVSTITARRFINCNGAGRSPVSEVAITWR
jgi:DNA adenine methylase